jgi:hypothetical protein
MARSSALRCVAGDIDKLALLSAFRADVRGYCSGYGETAMGTFPIGQAALWAYIPFEPAVGRVAAASTYPFVLFAFHEISPLMGKGRYTL